jgi:hypothetical protein
MENLKSSADSERFDAAMKKILSVSKTELQRRMQAEKQSKATASRAPASRAKQG